MRYTDEEALSEIMKRSSRALEKRREKACRALAATSAVLFVALLAVTAIFPGTAAGGDIQHAVYGSFLLSREAGGYVLASTIAFALGVTVTLFCIRYRQGTSTEASDKKDHEA
ncbi:MAG: hypothetical protein K6E84_04895 [Lachnospiraceae bacterium]|nr:hypothetical protein [Lachnospiraceae bacterium]